MATREITTPPCIVCKETSVVTVEAEAFQRWLGGELIQNVFPEKSTSERELMMTGTHPACWDEMFRDEDA